MNYINAPALTTIPFAQSATSTYRNAVPQTASSTPGAASYTTGFVPDNFLPIASGGIPPFGADFNGVLYDITLRQQYEQAGGNYAFSSAMATAIGGYPKGATVLRADGSGQWLNTTDGNTTDPDSSGAAGWIALRANTGTATIAATSGTVSPTRTQLGAQVLIVTGTLTANAILSLPLTAGAQWTVVNSTTGAHTLTVAGASGSGVAVAQGTGVIAYTDGTNYYSINAAISGAYLPINGTAVAATKLATARAFNLTGLVTADAVNFDGTGNVTLTTAIADGALSVAKTNGLQGALDAKVSAAAGYSPGNDANNVNGNANGNGFWAFTDASLNTPHGDWATLIHASQDGTGERAFQIAYSWNYGDFQIRWIGGAWNVLWHSGNFNPANYAALSGATFTGTVTAIGGFESSDRRLKRHIQPRAVQRGLALKLARMFAEWDRIADGVHAVGLVAQRVKAIASRYVIRGQKQGRRSGMLAIDKAGIALEASMDCALQLDEQAKTIKVLRRRIDKLEKAR